jgi:hypothetical protein
LTQDYCGWIGGAVGWEEEEAEEEAGAERRRNKSSSTPKQERIQNRISAVFGGESAAPNNRPKHDGEGSEFQNLGSM